LVASGWVQKFEVKHSTKHLGFSIGGKTKAVPSNLPVKCSETAETNSLYRETILTELVWMKIGCGAKIMTQELGCG
jgi:hypothetical protein